MKRNHRYSIIEIKCSKCDCDEDKLCKILTELPSAIGSKAVGEPVLNPFPRAEGRIGYTGHITLAASNIDVHTYPENTECEYVAAICGKKADFRRAIPYLKENCKYIKTIEYFPLVKGEER